MSKEIKAFPHSFERVPYHPGYAESEGMSLRDYFAAKAMQGEIASGGEITDKKACAEWCYEMADAMMKARGE